MSLSVERVRHMLEVAKKERAELWDDMDEVGRSFSNDCVSAFEELLAIKDAEPVAYECDGVLTDHPISYPGHVSVPLIRKPE